MFPDIQLVVVFDKSQCPPVPPRKDQRSAFGARKEQTLWDAPFVTELVDLWVTFKTIRRSECDILTAANKIASEGGHVRIDALRILRHQYVLPAPAMSSMKQYMCSRYSVCQGHDVVVVEHLGS